MKKYGLILILIVTLISGCSSNKRFKNMPAKEKFDKANAYYEKGKYRKAAEIFQNIVFERNSSYTAEAQMKLANCYFNQEKFLDAQFEYEELIRLFPDYPGVNLAYYKQGVCYFEESLSPHYTQEDTYKAIDIFQIFLDRFPFDENKQKAIDYINKLHVKLLEKKYYNGYIYYRTQDYSSALMYFDEITKLGNNMEIDKKALYYTAKIYIYRKNKARAENTLNIIKQRYPESKETAKIQKSFSKRFKREDDKTKE